MFVKLKDGSKGKLLNEKNGTANIKLDIGGRVVQRPSSDIAEKSNTAFPRGTKDDVKPAPVSNPNPAKTVSSKQSAVKKKTAKKKPAKKTKK